MKDPIVEEIRNIRTNRARQFGFELERIMADAIERDSAKRTRAEDADRRNWVVWEDLKPELEKDVSQPG